jgi:hypothetical protein
MNQVARDYIKSLVAQYELLLDNYELQPDNHSAWALSAFLQVYPGIKDFDSNGNFVGTPRNEDGWTA